MKVFIIFQCVVTGLCNSQLTGKNYIFSQELTLLSTNNEHHKALNNEFEIVAKALGYEIFIVALEESGILATIAASHNFENVINLRASIQTENFEKHSGDILEFNHSDLICVMNCELLTFVNASNTTVQKNNVTRGTGYARVVSQTLLKHPSVWEILENQIVPELPKILLCLPKPNIDRNNKLAYVQYFESIVKNFFTLNFKDNCDKNDIADEDLFAVIANSPLDSTSDVPTIFYQTPFDYPEYKDCYRNSINLTPFWRSQKYAFVKFLKGIGWRRVAVVSDDSEYSQVFSEELIPLLQNDGDFILTIKECEYRRCNFTSMLQALDDDNARIVILNIDKKYASAVVSAVYHLQINAFTWVVRDWPFNFFETQLPSDIYSINQFSVFGHTPNQEPYVSALSEGLNIITEVYERVLRDAELFRRKFVEVSDYVRQHRHRTIARVTRLRLGSPPVTVSDIDVTSPRAEFISFNVGSDIPPDTSEMCLVWSRDFPHPCQHGTLLLLMGIVIVFAFMQLIILVFFNYYRSEPRYDRFT